MGSKPFQTIWAIALAIAVTSVGCRQLSVENGKLLFNRHCARCHTYRSNQASPAPDLTDYFARNPQPTIRQARAIIRDGKQAMPPFGRRLSSQDIDDLIAYIKSITSSAAS